MCQRHLPSLLFLPASLEDQTLPIENQVSNKKDIYSHISRLTFINKHTLFMVRVDVEQEDHKKRKKSYLQVCPHHPSLL